MRSLSDKNDRPNIKYAPQTNVILQILGKYDHK